MTNSRYVNALVPRRRIVPHAHARDAVPLHWSQQIRRLTTRWSRRPGPALAGRRVPARRVYADATRRGSAPTLDVQTKSCWSCSLGESSRTGIVSHSPDSAWCLSRTAPLNQQSVMMPAPRAFSHSPVVGPGPHRLCVVQGARVAVVHRCLTSGYPVASGSSGSASACGDGRGSASTVSHGGI